MQSLQARNLQVIKVVTWVKVTQAGKLQPVIGHYFQHVTETCFILVKGEFISERSKKLIDRIPSVICQPKTINSAKPQALLRILRDTCIGDPNVKMADVFGRCNNLERGWYTVGLDAKHQYLHKNPENT